MTDIPIHKNWIKGIDSLRFILAMIVLLSHLDNPYINICLRSSYYPVRMLGYFLPSAFDGTAAVIAFFIISGFVIHYANKNGIKNLRTFWIRRFSRILIPVIAICLIGVKFNHPEKAVIWSLICELIYYFLYPFLAKIKISWLNKFIIYYAIAAIYIGFSAHSAIIAFFTQSGTNYPAYYWQTGIFSTWLIGLPVWLLGVLVAETVDKFKAIISFNKILCYRVVVFLISCLLTAAKLYWYLSYLLSMNLFAILLFKWIQAEVVYFKNKKPNTLLENMGKFSYSLYLCHPLIYVILQLNISITAATYPLFIAIIIFTSYLFYLAVEKPSHLLAIKLTTNPKK